MDQSLPLKIRDLRRTNYFTIDNDFIDKYAEVLGPIATMIYIVLCRHSDKQQESFPSQETIAKKIGSVRQTVNQKLKLLEQYNLISITHTKDKNTGEQLNNIYTLLDKSVWKDPNPNKTRVVSDDTDSDVVSDDTAHAQTRVVSDDTNNTHFLKKPIYDRPIVNKEESTDDFIDWREGRNKRRSRKASKGISYKGSGFSGHTPEFKHRRRGGIDASHIR